MIGKPATYVDFSGGVNAESSPYALAENQLRDARNVNTTMTGGLRKRNGLEIFATLVGAETAHSLVAAHVFIQYVVAATTAGKLVAINPSTAVVTTVKTGMSTTARWEWTQATSPTGTQIFGVNGTNTPQKWNGGDITIDDWVATTGSVPNGKYIAYLGGRIWIAGVAAQTSRLYYSDFTGTTPDPLVWPTTNYVDLGLNDGQPITGIGTFGDYLIVFKPRKTYVIYDLATGANRVVSSEIGCISHRSIVETERGLFFLSESEGVCVTTGESITRIGEPVMPFLRQAASDVTVFQYSAATMFDQSYWLSIPYGGTNNDLTLQFDLRTNSWWVHSFGVNQFALLDPANAPKLYVAQPGVSTVQEAFVADVYEDLGTPYTSYWVGPHLIFGNPHVTKRVHQVRVDGKGTWSLSAAVDFAESYTALDEVEWSSNTSIADTITWGDEDELWGTGSDEWGGSPPNTVKQMRYFTPGLGRAWSFKGQNTDNNPWELYALTASISSRTD